MPTPSPIIAARVGANVATSMKFAMSSTSPCPTPSDSSARPTGRNAPTTEPKAKSRMIRATITPMASLLGGSAEAISSACPETPTCSPSTPLAAATASSTARRVRQREVLHPGGEDDGGVADRRRRGSSRPTPCQRGPGVARRARRRESWGPGRCPDGAAQADPSGLAVRGHHAGHRRDLRDLREHGRHVCGGLGIRGRVPHDLRGGCGQRLGGPGNRGKQLLRPRGLGVRKLKRIVVGAAEPRRQSPNEDGHQEPDPQRGPWPTNGPSRY